ncbi:hypothetical protein RR42_m2716 [Cupriavidus basilensis]|uniref:Uncharacterized protein n=1 Tax=Cupriavidus basilensis TaxID=68895 RepID=A0A0C4YB00_9BURK|nr:hypothetical protein RR42_m2716 [Cupriavidus basilensis]
MGGSSRQGKTRGTQGYESTAQRRKCAEALPCRLKRSTCANMHPVWVLHLNRIVRSLRRRGQVMRQFYMGSAGIQPSGHSSMRHRCFAGRQPAAKQPPRGARRSPDAVARNVPVHLEHHWRSYGISRR